MIPVDLNLFFRRHEVIHLNNILWFERCTGFVWASFDPEGFWCWSVSLYFLLLLTGYNWDNWDPSKRSWPKTFLINCPRLAPFDKFANQTRICTYNGKWMDGEKQWWRKKSDFHQDQFFVIELVLIHVQWTFKEMWWNVQSTWWKCLCVCVCACVCVCVRACVCVCVCVLSEVYQSLQ